MATYLDCNATTPIEPAVADAVMKYMVEEFGNAGSRTHEYGLRAKKSVERAREQVAAVVNASPDEVIFTSGATEANNLAILGLAEHGRSTGKRHIVSTQIEHKAVLEPLEYLARNGFEVTLVPPTSEGWVDPDEVRRVLRIDTLLVSVMHANNETGVLQPIADVASLLGDHHAYLHVDAAQGFGKDIPVLQNRRLDLVSVSAHKIYGPKGIGALLARRRGHERVPLTPLMYGGGQERGLRPGTLPVPLIVGLGMAADLAVKESSERTKKCQLFRRHLLEALEPLGPVINGKAELTLPHAVNLFFHGVDSEALMVALKAHIATSNGSACTSHNYAPSHVLQAMRLPEEAIRGAWRVSWCHRTAGIEWPPIVRLIASIKG